MYFNKSFTNFCNRKFSKYVMFVILFLLHLGVKPQYSTIIILFIKKFVPTHLDEIFKKITTLLGRFYYFFLYIYI